MFTIHWDTNALIFSAAVTLLVDYYITSLLHRRYDRQFGWSFIVSGLVTFSMPLVILIGLPVYVITGILPVHWTVKAAALMVLFVPLVIALLLLKSRVLSKIFPDPAKHKQAANETV